MLLDDADERLYGLVDFRERRLRLVDQLLQLVLRQLVRVELRYPTTKTTDISLRLGWAPS